MRNDSRISEGLLWLVCILATGYFAAGRHLASEAADFRVAEFSARAETSEPEALRAPEPDMATWSQERKDGFAEHRDAELTEALLRIPRLELVAPVLSGVDQLTLDRGIGRVPWSALPGETGNLVLAGHRDSYFRQLDQLRIGDHIVVDDGQRKWTYVVESQDIVTPETVEVMDDTREPTLTLITCYPFYFIGPAPKRYVVAGRLLGSDPARSFR